MISDMVESELARVMNDAMHTMGHRAAVDKVTAIRGYLQLAQQNPGCASYAQSLICSLRTLADFAATRGHTPLALSALTVAGLVQVDVSRV